jgi:hypothetical protein
MKAQPKRFADRVFESVSSDSFDIYKITSPLVKIIEVSDSNSGRFVGGVVVNDTINDTINLLSDNEHTGFDGVQMQIKLNLVGLGYEI